MIMTNSPTGLSTTCSWTRDRRHAREEPSPPPVLLGGGSPSHAGGDAGIVCLFLAKTE